MRRYTGTASGYLVRAKMIMIQLKGKIKLLERNSVNDKIQLYRDDSDEMTLQSIQGVIEP